MMSMNCDGFQQKIRSPTPSISSQKAQWLAVGIAGQRYLIPLQQAGDIFPWEAPTGIPYTYDWFIGVVNFRGKILSVIDAFFFLNEELKNVDKFIKKTHIISTNPRIGVDVGIIVENLLGLRSEADGFVKREKQDLTFISAAYTDLEGNFWEEISLNTLVASKKFLEIQL